MANEFGTLQQVRAAIQKHGRELLEGLVTEHLLDSPRISDLGISEITSAGKFHDVESGVTVVGMMSKDGPTARIHLEKRVDNRTLTIIVEPHNEQSYAVLSSTADSDETTVYRASSNGSVTTSACIEDQACILVCEGGDPYGGCSCSSYAISCCSDGSCSVGGLEQPGCPVEYCCDNCVDICDNQTGDC